MWPKSMFPPPLPPATRYLSRDWRRPLSATDSQASGAAGRDGDAMPYWSDHSAGGIAVVPCHSMHARWTNAGRPCISCRLTASRSLCHRTQSPRARIVTRFTIPGSCDRPPARCESAWLQRRGGSVDGQLNCSHSTLSHARPRHAKGVLSDSPSHAP